MMWGTSSGSKSRFSSSPGSYSSSRNISYTAVKTDDHTRDDEEDTHDERQYMKMQVIMSAFSFKIEFDSFSSCR